MSTVIKGGTIVTADLTYKADVKIEGGKIVEIGPNLSGDEVLDANGDPITGGGASSWADLTGKPAVIAAGATAADARGAIGAGTSNLAIGSTGSTAKAGNWTPGIADLPAGSVLATTGTTRPTARTDITVFFLGADPGANALDGIDRWFGVA